MSKPVSNTTKVFKFLRQLGTSHANERSSRAITDKQLTVQENMEINVLGIPTKNR